MTLALALRPHQQAAFDEACQHLTVHDRVTIALPCGTGKTLVGQRLAQHVAPRGRSTILVLAPTVGLLAQTLRAWTRHSSRPLAPFVFCHDASVASGEFAQVPVSTSPAALAGWVRGALAAALRPTDPQVVVFATYQSSPRIADAHRTHALQPWGAVVADESHWCAGEFEAAFSTVVDDVKVPAAARIFLTATPRVRRPGAAAFCMDDPVAFGPMVAPLAVRAAIDARLLSDYVVAVVAVTDTDVREAITAAGGGGSVRVGEQVLPAQRVAVQLAVAAAARTYGLRRIMVFHNTVGGSQEFTNTLGEVVAADGGPAGLVAMHVDGATPARRRAESLETLADPGVGRWAVLSNVRCLGQGIDVPALDGVVFAGPRTSHTDITQCVGRALRLDPTRADPAVIVLPVLVDTERDLAAQVRSSRFRHVYRTLLALADHDTQLADELVRRRGTGGRGGGGRRDKVVVLDAAGAQGLEELRAALQVRALRLLTPGWDHGFAQLQAYVERVGDARVPANYVTADGFPLGAWVRGNRNRARLTPERIARLESVFGWVWNLHDAAWWEGLARLNAFAAEHGHTRIPRGYRCPDEFALDQWASVQRADARRGRLSAERRAALRAAGLSLDPEAERWANGIAHLREFVAQHGHASPSQNYVSPDGFLLGQWCHHLRKRRLRLTPAQVAEVEAFTGWVWDVLESRWRAGLGELAQFRARHGHVRVPRDYITPGGEPLGKWFDRQRCLTRAGSMPAHRRALLDNLDPDWAKPQAVARLKGAPRG
ncbi:hypothetical protein BKN37_13595 [Mycobacterium talmoniae]|uniref:Helicase ATP-binding domain-containing protein n=1 Tax=Mycobacterium talmoniae TaxID=1858794 RepID=A0A1S1NH08_9MYCO|nr:hypothetical protein BKN37_13595 [Mycobacterium talmoniae]